MKSAEEIVFEDGEETRLAVRPRGMDGRFALAEDQMTEEDFAEMGRGLFGFTKSIYKMMSLVMPEYYGDPGEKSYYPEDVLKIYIIKCPSCGHNMQVEEEAVPDMRHCNKCGDELDEVA